jgi:hypothetical protein
MRNLQRTSCGGQPRASLDPAVAFGLPFEAHPCGASEPGCCQPKTRAQNTPSPSKTKIPPTIPLPDPFPSVPHP